MKIYSPSEEPKSWSAKLVTNIAGDTDLVAVDSTTGEPIARLLMFTSKGIHRIVEASETLKESGYDPNEHGTPWAANGSLLMIPSPDEATKKEPKLWTKRLKWHNGSVLFVGVDSTTGEEICVLGQVFPGTNYVVRSIRTKWVLERKGYDPYQHNDAFDDRGECRTVGGNPSAPDDSTVWSYHVKILQEVVQMWSYYPDNGERISLVQEMRRDTGVSSYCNGASQTMYRKRRAGIASDLHGDRWGADGRIIDPEPTT